MSAEDDRRIVEEAGRFLVDGYLVDNAPEIQRASVAIYRLLAQGAPVDRDALAAALGLAPAAAAALVARFPESVRRLDGEGRLVAFIGLDLAETDHRFEVAGRVLHTWCVLDALFLPEILGEHAVLTAVCPATGEAIRVEVGPAALGRAEPAQAVMSLVAPAGSDCGNDLRGAFCRHVNLYRDAAACERRIGDRRGTAWITLADAFLLARRRNAGRFADIAL